MRSRSLEGAVLDEYEAKKQLELLAIQSAVQTMSGQLSTLHIDTICIHSDTEGSFEMAKQTSNYLQNENIKISAAAQI